MWYLPTAPTSLLLRTAPLENIAFENPKFTGNNTFILQLKDDYDIGNNFEVYLVRASVAHECKNITVNSLLELRCEYDSTVTAGSYNVFVIDKRTGNSHTVDLKALYEMSLESLNSPHGSIYGGHKVSLFGRGIPKEQACALCERLWHSLRISRD